jgi:hypothetical protein
MRRLVTPTLAIVSVILLLTAAVAVPRVEAAPSPSHPLKNGQASVTGTFQNSAAGLKGPGTFTGTFTIHNVTVEGKHLIAHGTLAGTLKDANGKTKSISHTVSLPLSGITEGGTSSSMMRGTMAVGNSPMQTGSCNILTLDIGAVHLNLLGLVVDLSPIHLTITGQTGSGALLGNLLCGVAGLLNNTTLAGLTQQLLQDVAQLLNQVLAGL